MILRPPFSFGSRRAQDYAPESRWRALKRRLRTVGLASAIALSGTASAQVVLPNIGDVSSGSFSSSEERELAEAFLREIRRHLTLVEDPEIVRYIKNLGAQLASATDDGDQPFQFLAIGDRSINAFAGPGGVIGVNTGLILASNSESELAAVIAHEIAHVTQKHLARAIDNAERFTLPALAGMLAALVLASQNAQAGQAALAGVLAGSAQRSLDFTRSNEQEADRVGIEILARAGFDPRAVPAFFEELQRANRFYAEPPEFLSTHPVTVKRIADSRARAERYPYKQYTDSLDYLLVREKLRAFVPADPKDAVREFANNIKSGQVRNPVAAQYGYAVALVRDKKFSDAKGILEKLTKGDPERINFLAGLAYVNLKLGQAEEAFRLYRNALRIYPNDRALAPAYAEALYDQDNAEQAETILSKYKKHQELNAREYELLARIYAKLGNRFAANAAIAESHYLEGDLSTAIHSLGVALRSSPPNDYESSRVEARLSELEQEQEERQKRNR
ncbi:MAG: M48 family metalloprotease [Pseudomonadota bacterium]